jgi:hypothetical protein
VVNYINLYKIFSHFPNFIPCIPKYGTNWQLQLPPHTLRHSRLATNPKGDEC